MAKGLRHSIIDVHFKSPSLYKLCGPRLQAYKSILSGRISKDSESFPRRQPKISLEYRSFLSNQGLLSQPFAAKL